MDISLAALLGENVYNFGELLLHPIVRTAVPTLRQFAASCVLAYLFNCSTVAPNTAHIMRQSTMRWDPAITTWFLSH